MDITKVQAILAVKKNKQEDVGKWSSVGNTGDGLSLQVTQEIESEVYTKYDFEEPQEENFMQYVRELVNHPEKLPEGVTATFLGKIEEDSDEQR